MRAGVLEPEQDRERPAAGERRAEHLGADQDRRRDHGDDARPVELAFGRRQRGGVHGLKDLVCGGMLTKKARGSSLNWLCECQLVSALSSSSPGSTGRSSTPQRLWVSVDAVVYWMPMAKQMFRQTLSGA